MPTEETLASIYADYYVASTGKGASAASEKVTIDRPERFAEHIRAGLAKSFDGGRVRILDFGGGDGTISCLLARLLLDRNRCAEVQVALVDSSRQAVDGADKRVAIKSHASLGDLGAEDFDVVIASAVLEHIPEPKDVILQLLDRLKAGGVFYARTPYISPLLKLCPFRAMRRRLFTYPFHLHDMGQAFWERVLPALNIAGSFRLIKSRPSIVESSLHDHFFRAVASALLKSPWHVFGESYGLVGGWEVFIQRSPARSNGSERI
jgi:SAM-dependent methyltransferase